MIKDPSYLYLHKTKELKNRVQKVYEILKSCTLCPFECKVNRIKGELGICRSGSKAIVSSCSPHHGEEPMLSGTKGSGTIFFSNCNLKCLFCQNYQISQEGLGNEVSDEQLANMMIELQNKGCHNINLVSPTHFVANILGALEIANSKGLKIPIVYNSNGYESLDTLKLFDGIIDIYLPDIKYSDNKTALRLSAAPNYVDFNRPAIKEMFRQVGDLVIDDNGIATKGMLVRMLVLPNDLNGSRDSLEFLSRISKDMWISIMAQYNPCYKAIGDPEIGRKITDEEYRQVLKWAKELELNNYLVQELESSDIFVPDFKSTDPFK